jgi:hypothetical protein
MLVYKALYRKMMDDLKDAGMWIDWAEQIHSEHPDQAKFLLDSAKERLHESFPDTHKHFKKVCEDMKSGVCVDEIVCDHMMEWYHSLKMKLESMEDKPTPIKK